jgi:hypothetical protein
MVEELTRLLPGRSGSRMGGDLAFTIQRRLGGLPGRAPRSEVVQPASLLGAGTPSALLRADHVLAYLAGRTSTVRLGVSVLVMPVRNPIVTAIRKCSCTASSRASVRSRHAAARFL